MTKRKQMELFKVNAFTFTEQGVTASGTPTVEEWSQALYVAGKARSGVQWGIGELLLYGDMRKFDEDVYENAMEATGLKRGTLMNMKSLAKTFPRHKRFDLSWSHHALVAGLEEDEAKALLRRASSQNLSWEELRAIAREARHAKRVREQDWPTGTYGLILADPSWTYEAGAVDPTRDVNNQYPPMPTDQIMALSPRIQAIAAPSVVLYMWATSAKMVSGEAVDVLRAWGFTGKSTQVWVKDIQGMGYWARQRHEHLIIATRGNPVPPAEDVRPDSVITAPRRDHSQKPDAVYVQLERIYPGVPRIELFARPPFREGWEHWGNEELVDPAEAERGIRVREAVA